MHNCMLCLCVCVYMNMCVCMYVCAFICVSVYICVLLEVEPRALSILG